MSKQITINLDGATLGWMNASPKRAGDLEKHQRRLPYWLKNDPKQLVDEIDLYIRRSFFSAKMESRVNNFRASKERIMYWSDSLGSVVLSQLLSTVVLFEGKVFRFCGVHAEADHSNRYDADDWPSPTICVVFKPFDDDK